MKPSPQGSRSGQRKKGPWRGRRGGQGAPPYSPQLPEGERERQRQRERSLTSESLPPPLAGANSRAIPLPAITPTPAPGPAPPQRGRLVPAHLCAVPSRPDPSAGDKLQTSLSMSLCMTIDFLPSPIPQAHPGHPPWSLAQERMQDENLCYCVGRLSFPGFPHGHMFFSWV